MTIYVKDWDSLDACLQVWYHIEDDTRAFRKKCHIFNLTRVVGIEVYNLRSRIEDKESSKLLRIDFGGEENSYTLKFIDEYQRTEFVKMVYRELADATQPASCCHD